jgi:hypothetical protein
VEDLERVDGLVLEEAGTKYERLELDELRGQKQYKQTLQVNLDRNRAPVFVADIPPKGGRTAYHEGRYTDTFSEIITVALALAVIGILGALLGIPLTLCLCLPFGILLIFHVMPTGLVQQAGYVGEVLRRLLAYGQVMNSYSLAAARSAAVAETLDRFLLPYLRRQSGSRPELLVDYGATHLDIYMYLQPVPFRVLKTG